MILESIVCELKENIDRLVVIYTSCACLMGILVGISDDACKLVSRSMGQNRSRPGGITICRLCDIQAVTLCDRAV